MRPSGKDGYGYHVEFGAEIVGDGAAALPANGWYMITALAGVTAFPAKDGSISDGESLAVNDFFYGTTSITPAVGDKCKPMTLTFLSFCKDIDQSAQKQKFDDSTQEDVKNGVKSFTESALSEKSGSISGHYEIGSSQQELLERRFGKVIKDDGTNITRLPTVSGIFPFMMSRRETTEVGEIEVWEYMPMIVDSLSTKKPLEGNQEFNFNYTVDGKSHPGIYKKTVAA